MKKYLVVITPAAEADIIDSFIWGCGEWGIEAAHKWANEARTHILKNLSTFPLKYPIVFGRTKDRYPIRKMAVGRYRVLFQVRQSEVFVLHVGAPFASGDDRLFLE